MGSESTKKALVTGGTGGLGTAICRALADMRLDVVANYHPDYVAQAKEWQAKQADEGYSFALFAADVSDLEQCRGMASDIGAIDCLVNNAGITRDSRFQKMLPEHWQAVIDTNLNSAFNVTQPFLDGMIDRGYGRIVNISSLSGQTGNFGQTNYAAAKAGVHGFTMSLSREVASKGITVNSVSPGFIGTEMVRAMPLDVLDKVSAMVPVGRLGEPHEIGRTVAFLCDEQSGYITGADISVNGGLYM
ncbi:MAG: acetoacetyl-CoA reductase [Pseudomonadota bacterium]